MCRPVPLFGLLGLALTSACALDYGEPSVERAWVPDRGVGPWRLASLEVCDDGGCGDEAAGVIQSADVAYDAAAGRFLVAAALADGAIYLGELSGEDEDWSLSLDASPALSPALAWQASGLADPDLLLAPPGGAALAVAYAVVDGSAVGYATGDRDRLDAAATPLVTDDDHGLGAPSLVSFADGVVLAYAYAGAGAGAGIDEGPRILMASGTDLASLDEPFVGLEATAVTDDAGGYAWGPLSAMGDPDLGVTADGLLRLFFSGRGSSLAKADAEPTPVNTSIGYAAAEVLGPLEPYADNPVHDRTFGYLFRADERAPAVADDGVTAVMLYQESLRSEALPALAVHELGR